MLSGIKFDADTGLYTVLINPCFKWERAYVMATGFTSKESAEEYLVLMQALIVQCWEEHGLYASEAAFIDEAPNLTPPNIVVQGLD